MDAVNSQKCKYCRRFIRTYASVSYSVHGNIQYNTVSYGLDRERRRTPHSCLPRPASSYLPRFLYPSFLIDNEIYSGYATCDVVRLRTKRSLQRHRHLQGRAWRSIPTGEYCHFIFRCSYRRPLKGKEGFSRDRFRCRPPDFKKNLLISHHQGKKMR